MKAKIRALDHKYYGTIIDVETNKGKTSIEIWFMGDYEPSIRELSNWNIEENGPFEICDNHFESKDGYKLATIICKAINDIQEPI